MMVVLKLLFGLSRSTSMSFLSAYLLTLLISEEKTSEVPCMSISFGKVSILAKLLKPSLFLEPYFYKAVCFFFGSFNCLLFSFCCSSVSSSAISPSDISESDPEGDSPVIVRPFVMTRWSIGFMLLFRFYFFKWSYLFWFVRLRVERDQRQAILTSLCSRGRPEPLDILFAWITSLSCVSFSASCSSFCLIWKEFYQIGLWACCWKTTLSRSLFSSSFFSIFLNCCSELLSASVRSLGGLKLVKYSIFIYV